MNDNLNNIETIISIVDNIDLHISSDKIIIYEKFKHDYIVFLNILYKRLFECEIKNLEQGIHNLDTYILEFGTDEFQYEFEEEIRIFLEIEKFLGNQVSPDKYKNHLINFQEMYYNFFKLIDCDINSDYGLEQFDKLMHLCLNKLGFKVKSVEMYKGILFKIDTCSRIEKLMRDFKDEEYEYIKSHPEIRLPIITTKEEVYDYIKPRLEKWNEKKDEDNKKLLKN